jgi:antirestriction protein ArdC
MAGKLSREEYLAQQAERVEQLTEAMSDRVAAIATGPEAREFVAFAARFRSRSPRNAALIYAQWEERCEKTGQDLPQPTQLAGYKQFQEMGRQVRRGEKGYQILSPVTARFVREGEEWRRLGPRERPAPGAEVQKKMIGVKPATVFDIAQTDGPEIPRPPEWAPLAAGEVPAGLREAVEAEIRREGFRLEAIDGGTAGIGAEGSTHFATKVIEYNATRPANDQVATLLHELGHIKLHSPDNPAGSMHRGQEEFEAETFAHVVAGLHGMDTAASSDSYAAGWTLGATRGDDSRVAELTVNASVRVIGAVNDTIDRMPAGGVVPDGSIPKPDKLTAQDPEQQAAERRVRNALRLEAQAPARIREDPPVPEKPGQHIRNHR